MQTERVMLQEPAVSTAGYGISNPIPQRLRAIQKAKGDALEFSRLQGTDLSSGNRSADANTADTPNIAQLLEQIYDDSYEDLNRELRHISPAQTTRVSGMQKWQGRVIDVEEGIFSAELVPLDHKGPTVVADFDSELLEGDGDGTGPLEGDVFYLTVRTIRRRGGHTTRTSSLRTRRLGKWSEEELAQMRREARADLNGYLKYVD